MKLAHEYDCIGNHRITIDNEHGEPSLYEHPAFMMKDGKWYMALTPYYEGSIDHEMCQGVFELTGVGEDVEDAIAYNLFSEDGPCPWIKRGQPCNITTKCPQRPQKEVSKV